MAENQTQSPLLALPPEIRTQIWRDTFTLSTDKVSLAFSPRAARYTSILRALLTCKLLYREAYHMFYSCNTLYLCTPAALFYFLSSLSPLRREAITSLAVGSFNLHYTGAQMASQAFSLLNLCPRLEGFQLELGTDISWNVLEQVPVFESEMQWQTWNEAFQCLAALRGLKWVSVKGLNPDIFRRESTYGPELLTEVEDERVEALKKRWLRPRGTRTSRVQRAFKDMKARTRKRMKEKSMAQPVSGIGRLASLGKEQSCLAGS